MTPKRPFLLLALSSLALCACGEGEGDDPGEAGAAYSREKILPLVSSPGKERGLFSSFTLGKKSVWNKEFWGASLGFDQFTGVGWGTGRAGVLVTPEHVLCAGHYPVNQDGVHFYGKDGEFLGRRGPALSDDKKEMLRIKLPQDIRVVRLERPAPAGARIYALPDPKTHPQRVAWSALPEDQRPLLVATDWRNLRPKRPGDPEERRRWVFTRSAHPVRLAPRTNNELFLSWRYGKQGDPAVDPSYHENVNQGDSSHPLFWVTRSGLVLASTFSGAHGGPDYGHPEVQASIQEAINTLGGERPYTLKTAPVP